MALSAWWQALRADPIAWLLDETAPNVSWRVLVELFDRPDDSRAVVRARGGANVHEPVATLLEPLLPDGRWSGGDDGPVPCSPEQRFVSAVGAGADPGDPRLAAAADRFLDGEFRGVDPCAAARELQALHALGWGHDLRFEERAAWFAEEAPSSPGGGWACNHPSHQEGEWGCTVTAVALLQAVHGERDERSNALRSRATEVLVRALEGRAANRDNLWQHAGHPNLDRTDAVEALWALARAGVGYDRRMRGALIEQQARQDDRGRWTLEITPPCAAVAGAEHKGLPSRWVTLHMLVALRAYAVPAGLPRLFPSPESEASSG